MAYLVLLVSTVIVILFIYCWLIKG